MSARPRVDILNIGFFDANGVRAFTGGAERYVLDLARLLFALGLQPRLMQNARVSFQREVEGFEVLGIPAAAGFDLSAMSAGFAEFTRDAALIIASPAELASRLGDGPPVIAINHGVWWDLPGYRGTHPELADREPLFAALRRSDACVSVDTNFINWLRASGEAYGRVDYIPNYVDHGKFRPVAKDFRAARLEVLFPRRLCAERGFHETLRAFEMLWARDTPCNLHLCGGGAPAEETLAREFVARHSGRARWSEVGPEDMPAIYRDSHVVIVPTLFSEGTSLACLEAMATHHGIVATYVGGLPNLILDEVNGLLVEPGAEALAAALRRLVADRALLASMAARAREVAATFSSRRWQERWCMVLADVVPSLAPGVARWSADRSPVPAMRDASASEEIERDLAVTRTALQDVDARLWVANRERDGAYRTALVATFDRDAARRDAGGARTERDAAMEGQRAARGERDAAERELTERKGQLDALRNSRGVRWLRALDRRGRFLLPPQSFASDAASTTPTAVPSTAAPQVAIVEDGVPGDHAQSEAGAGLRAMRAACCGLAPGRVSVVLPVYNHADMVADAIRSVLGQSYVDLELIVVDDGSSDALAPVLALFESEPRVRVLVQPNLGLPQALTNGFALAQGEYWTWTSADNLMAPRQLEVLVERLEGAPDVGMVYADFWVIDDRGNPLADVHWRSHDRPDPHSNVVHPLRSTERLNVVPDNFIGACFLYRGWIGRLLGPYDGEQGVEDYAYWVRINSFFTIAHLGTDEPLYRYRVHDNTLSARGDSERIPIKVERLMSAERDRAQWNRLPLDVQIELRLARRWPALLSMNEGTSIFDDPRAIRLPPEGPGVVIACACGAALLAALDGLGESLPLVLVVERDAFLPEDALSLLRRTHVLVVVENAGEADRIRAVADVPVVDGASTLLGLAITAFARDASYRAREAR